MTDPSRDRFYMRMAIHDAMMAVDAGDRPFGCVIVKPPYGAVLAHASGSEMPDDPTRHSEILAIQEACRKVKGLLYGCTIYSTHEPCMMCCGGILHSKLSRVVYGSARADLPGLFREYSEPVVSRLGDTSHPPEVRRVLTQECIDLFAGELSMLASGRASF